MNRFSIHLEEMRIEMYLGIHDFERASRQRVLISARIEVEIADDHEAGYFDYDRVADFIRSFSGKRIDTQEELVMRVHAFILGLGDVTHAEVCSKKPDVYEDSKAVGVCFSGNSRQSRARST